MGGVILNSCRLSTVDGKQEYSRLYFLFSLVRYRFFIFAGIFPFLLGQAAAFNFQNFLDWRCFWLGCLGILFVLIGVELFNEHFDAKAGGDRIFSHEPANIPSYFFPLGIFVFFLAFLIGLYLTFQIGWPVLLFSFLGFLGAYFYLAPPLRWVYLGWGELVIAFSYGPFMVLGSYYIQVKRIDFMPFFVSLICGLSLFSLAFVNEIPDYYQDRLVGKKNLVVRLGKAGAIKVLFLSPICLFFLLGLGVSFGYLPGFTAFSFLVIPWFIKSLRLVAKNYDDPMRFRSVINVNIVTYLVVVLTMGIGYISQPGMKKQNSNMALSAIEVEVNR